MPYAGVIERTVHPRWLLAFLIVAWAISWPAVKVGVEVVPPIWYGFLRYAIAAVCLLLLVAIRGELDIPSRADWPLVAVSGMLQMAAYSALTGFALTILPPGRASVLAFSTPIWVVPVAGWWLREPTSRIARLGAFVGLLGVLAIVAPSLKPGGARQMLGYLTLLGAAAAWAVSIVFVRRHRFTATALSLAPWQMLTAAGLLLPLAVLAEGSPPALRPQAIASLAYVGPVATAFAYWAVVETGRHFRATTLSVALLATPSLGIVLSALTLGEPIGISLITGVVLTAAGIWLVTWFATTPS